CHANGATPPLPNRMTCLLRNDWIRMMLRMSGTRQTKRTLEKLLTLHNIPGRQERFLAWVVTAMSSFMAQLPMVSTTCAWF
ncbi:hypothetical protein LTR40_014316, partial [Exophiala xenobiotica]